MRRPRGLFAFPIALLALFLLALESPAQMTPEVKKVGEVFACQCGSCNNQVSVCPMLNCSSATPLREEIAAKLKEGMNEQQIIEAFVAKYGKAILSAPPTRGVDLAAWTLPFVMLLLGLIVVFVIIRTWLQPRRAEPAGAPGDVPIPEAYQKQIERELKNFDG